MAKSTKKSNKKSGPAKSKEVVTKNASSLLHFDRVGFRQLGWPFLIIAILGAVLYAKCIPFGYVLDDKIVITENAYTKQGIKGLGKIFTTESFEGYFKEQRNLIQGGRYRPLSIATFAVEQSISPNNYRLSHSVNILLYILCGFLIYRLLLFFYPHRPNWWMTIPFVVSILYMVHPIHVEAVANIKGRDEILALLFGGLSIYYAIRTIKAESRVVPLILMGLTYYLGVLSKENILSFLGVIPVLLYLFHRSDYKKIVSIFLVLLGITIAYLIQRYAIIGFLIDSAPVTDVMNNPFVDMSGGERLATIMYTLGKYLMLIIVPHPLTHDYYPYQIPIMNWAKPSVWLSLLTYLGLTIYAILRHRKHPHLSFGWIFFLATIFLVSNLVISVGTFMNERFAFIPSLGILWMVIHLLMENGKRWIKPGLALGLCGVIFAGYSVKTFTRVPVWESPMTLNRAAVKVSTNSARANSFMGTALFNQYRVETDPMEKKRLLDEADIYIKRSLEIIPDYTAANVMAAGVAAENFRMKPDMDLLLSEFEKVILQTPSIKYIDEYIPYYIDDSRYQGKILDFYARIGEQLRQQGDYRWALHHLAKGNKVNPNHPGIRKGIAATYRSTGDEAKARQFD
jgi:hypothetical protein